MDSNRATDKVFFVHLIIFAICDKFTHVASIGRLMFPVTDFSLDLKTPHVCEGDKARARESTVLVNVNHKQNSFQYFFHDHIAVQESNTSLEYCDNTYLYHIIYQKYVVQLE